MKTLRQNPAIRIAAMGAAVLLTQTGAQAESQYGYSPSGGTGVTAQAKVDIEGKVPTLILLRVGTANTTVDKLTFTPVPAVTTTPNATTLGAHTTDVSNQASDWGGAAPSFSAPTGQPLLASTWTNSNGGGQLALASVVTTAMTGAGALAPSHITVSPAAGAGSMPAHPGTTADATIGTFTRNTLHSATWTYSVDATALAAAPAGTYVQRTTYTATAL